uniref:Sodium channel protein Nach n=1 Tax=Strongyloides papillosus TaxID=174720 RepID=A0A0N5BAZ0_STREA
MDDDCSDGFERSSSWRRRSIKTTEVTAFDIISLKNHNTEEKKIWVEMLHGLEYILLMKSKKAKIAWGIFLGIAVLVSIYLTFVTVGDLIENKTVTLDTIRRSDKILYHGITICPKYSDTFNYTNVKNKFLEIRNDLDNKTVNDLIIYTVAGGGFDNYNRFLTNLSDSRMNDIDDIFKDILKYFGDMKNLYKYIFEDENFKCEDFFEECSASDDLLDCCELFQPTFVLIRGRCYKLKKFYQVAPDEWNKLRLTLKALPSVFIDKNEFQEQIVIYNSPKTDGMTLYPRYYIYGRDWNRFKFTKQMYKILHNQGNCNNDKNYKGIGVCYVNEWIRQKIHDKYNCTLFYLDNTNNNLSICSPKIIVNNYNEIMEGKLGEIKCNQACTREEVIVSLITRPFSYTLAGIEGIGKPRIHIEMSYERLQEYIYQDVLVTTVSGFISELGGHTGLFVGFTIVSVIQFFYIIFEYIFKEFSKMKIKNADGIKL